MEWSTWSRTIGSNIVIIWNGSSETARCIALAMPLLAPLADFASVSRATTITAWIAGHGLTLLFSPTSVVVVGGLAIAKVGYDRYLRFVWPLILGLFVVSAAIIAIAAGLE